MQQLAAIILPVFALIAIGYLAAWSGLLGQAVADGLSLFTFNLAIPVLVFRVIVQADMPDASPWAYWLAYFAGTAGAWLTAGLAAAFLLGASPLRAAMGGCASAYSNTMLMGLPLVLTVFGEAGAVPLFLLITIHLPVMMMAAILSLEISGRGAVSDWRRIGRDTVIAVVTYPVIVGIAAGFAWRLTDFGVHPVMAKVMAALAETAIPCALVAMGLSLRRYGIRGDMSLTGLILACKLVLHPLLVWFCAVWLFALPPVWAGVATLFAAAPSGINTYVLASRYDAAVGAVSSAILIGSGLSLFTITAIMLATGMT